jgi:hypothetical protein
MHWIDLVVSRPLAMSIDSKKTSSGTVADISVQAWVVSLQAAYSALWDFVDGIEDDF